MSNGLSSFIIKKVVSICILVFVFIWDRLYLFESQHILTSVTFSLMILALLLSIINWLAKRHKNDELPMSNKKKS